MNTLSQTICRDFRIDPKRTISEIRESLALGMKNQPGGIRPDEFSLRALFEGLVTDSTGDVCGHHLLREMVPSRSGNVLLEAGDGVDVSAFSNITGQIVFSKIMEGYHHPAFVFSRLVPSQPTKLDGEKIPGATSLGDAAGEIHEGMPYPRKGFKERYVETPATQKRGFIVPVSKEAVFFDRTNLVLQRAAQVGESLGLNKEKRIVDVAIGASNSYKENGTSYNTFQAATPWINLLASNDLEDWTDIDNSLQLFSDMVDPDSGEPILINATDMVVTPRRQFSARRIVGGEVQTSTAAGDQVTIATSPVSDVRPHTSVVMYNRLQDPSGLNLSSTNAAKNWLIGDFKKALAYMENWPITVTQAPLGSPADFEQDIVAQFKASERGAAAVLDPRYLVKSTH